MKTTQNMGFLEIMIGQTIGVLHQVQKKEFLNLIKLETLIIGAFGGVKNPLKITILKFLHL